jgi:hypothetical protein
LRWICDYHLPQLDAGNLEAVKQFTRDGWIVEQKKWYEKRSHELKTNHIRTMFVSCSLFLAAAVFAVFHASSAFHSQKIHWEALTIIAAALGASVGGYRAYRVYRPISLQYREMAEDLAQAVVDIDNAKEPKALVEVLTRALDTFNFEHQGWRVLVHVHEPSDAI